MEDVCASARPGIVYTHPRGTGTQPVHQVHVCPSTANGRRFAVNSIHAQSIVYFCRGRAKPTPLPPRRDTQSSWSPCKPRRRVCNRTADEEMTKALDTATSFHSRVAIRRYTPLYCTAPYCGPALSNTPYACRPHNSPLSKRCYRPFGLTRNRRSGKRSRESMSRFQVPCSGSPQ